MENDSQTEPGRPAAPRKFFLRRIYISTWLVMLLTSGIMFLAVWPGRRTSAESYTHGWPFAWSVRGRISARVAEPWEIDVPNESIERSMDPWAVSRIDEFNVAAFVADAAIALAIMAAIGWLFQCWRRRRRSLLQFRLRTLFLATTAAAAVCAMFTAWNRDRISEEVAIEKLQAMVAQSSSGLVCQRYLNLPPWLPESLAKAIGLDRYFYRMGWIALDDTSSNDDCLAVIESFKHLIALSMNPAKIDAGWQSVGRLSSLRRLDINSGFAMSDEEHLLTAMNDACTRKLSKLNELSALEIGIANITDAGLAELSKLKNLSRFQIHSPAISSRGLADFAKSVPRLTSLSIESPRLDDEVTDAIKSLQNLGELNLIGTRAKHLRFANLPALKVLRVAGNKPVTIDLSRVASLESLEIDPTMGRFLLSGQLESSYPDSTPLCPEVTIGGQKGLHELGLSNVTIKRDELGAVLESKSLEVLVLHRIHLTPPREQEPLDLIKQPQLTRVEFEACPFSELRVTDCPTLFAVAIDGDNTIRMIRLERLAKLTNVELKVGSALELISLDGLNSAREFKLEFEGRPSKTHLRGLAELSGLEQLSLTAADSIPASELDEISRLSNLNDLEVTWSNLRNHSIATISSLSKLESLNLTGNKIDDGAVEQLAKLQSLVNLNLSQTAVSPAGIARLKAVLQNAQYISN